MEFAERTRSSSYIDSVILRDRDITSRWSGGVDGALEDRVYHCQNAGGWRADVAGLTNAYGEQIETAKYSSYGTPFCLPAGDVDADGDNSGDYTQINTWIGLSQYHDRADLNMDGVLDSADSDLAFDADGTSGGRGVLSTEVVGNRKGYAGYENDGAVTRFAHVRHRVLDTHLGRMTSRQTSCQVVAAYMLRQPPRKPWTINPPLGPQGPAPFDPAPVPGWPYPSVWPLPSACDGTGAECQHCCENHGQGMLSSCDQLFPDRGADWDQCTQGAVQWIAWCQQSCGAISYNNQIVQSAATHVSTLTLPKLRGSLGGVNPTSPGLTPIFDYIPVDPSISTPTVPECAAAASVL